MESIEKVLNRYSVKLISIAFIILGVVVFLDVLIVKNELLKIVITFLSIVGLLHIVANFFIYTKEKFSNFSLKRNDNKTAIETFKTLSKEEAKYVYEFIHNGKRRFKCFDIVDLLQSKIFIQKTELTEDIIVELNPVVRKYLEKLEKLNK